MFLNNGLMQYNFTMLKPLRLSLHILVAFLFFQCNNESSEEPTPTNSSDTEEPAIQEVFTFTDDRDGQIYDAITIGNQVWMSENLNYENDNSWCYNNDSNNCNIYGRLYEWESAKIACPTGWHLPSDEEWTQLSEYLGNETSSGGKLKEKGTKNWISPNTGATDEVGFNALPGGYRVSSPISLFTSIGKVGYWWSSTQNSSNNYVWFRQMFYQNSDLFRHHLPKNWSCSVRCIKD